MKIVYSSSHQAAEPRAVAIGKFDGIHLGHQAILRALGATASHLKRTVLTFEPLPHHYFSQSNQPLRLVNVREKCRLLLHYGAEQISILPFNARVATLSADAFVQSVLIERLNAKHVVVGENFRYGHQRQGTLSTLRTQLDQANIALTVVPLQATADGQTISSSHLRSYLAQGDLATARVLCQRPYSLSGRVIKGQQLARTLGFATANIRLMHSELVLHGVFATRLHLSQPHALDAVANIGWRPTVKGRHYVLEVHALDWQGDLYGQQVVVEFCDFIRKEQSFNDLETLRQQILVDADCARQYFLRNKLDGVNVGFR